MKLEDGDEEKIKGKEKRRRKRDQRMKDIWSHDWDKNATHKLYRGTLLTSVELGSTF